MPLEQVKGREPLSLLGWRSGEAGLGLGSKPRGGAIAWSWEGGRAVFQSWGRISRVEVSVSGSLGSVVASWVRAAAGGGVVGWFTVSWVRVGVPSRSTIRVALECRV